MKAVLQGKVILPLFFRYYPIFVLKCRSKQLGDKPESNEDHTVVSGAAVGCIIERAAVLAGKQHGSMNT